jgi:uncharacterized protein YyaL (SSP411 family)/aryl-alcohol dehydrogenase-like predicted oxidoreductase
MLGIRMPNRLANETSPYLLQHANNPVDWYAWGPEALERSKREDKPILLSIGYAACHWCHVMERESFENESIAKLMNDSFVCIKVDREERPDLDEIYMAATVAMSGSGGWPMTVFLTPEQEPFFAGTYFPPSDKYGRPGFPTLLERISEAWKGDRTSVHAQARELTEHVREQNTLARPRAVGAKHLERAVTQLAQTFDDRFGGFGTAPKFPPSSGLLLLLRHHHVSDDAQSLEMVTATLDGMKNGGMYDHVGGGFARYSTDERWLVPHFEKMLYDNAQLSRAYLEAYQVTKNPEYRRVAPETLDYIVREMQSEGGGYFSATDADSEGEEGKFFVWQPDEIVAILGNEAAERFSLHYDIRERGNWEGKSIANTPRPLEETAKELGMEPDALRAELDRSKELVYEARAKRIPPLLDDKILTAWNGLMIGAMAEGYRVLGEARWLESAERAANDIVRTMTRPDGGLYRTARAGKAHLDGYLEDYAFLANALVDLFEAGGRAEHLTTATRLAERMLADFGDEEAGAFYFTAHGHEALIARTREGHDGAIANPNAVAAHLLARLAVHTGLEAFRERAMKALRAYGALVERSPRAFATTLLATEFLLAPVIELCVVGAVAAREPLLRAIAEHYLPNRVIALVDPSAPSQGPLVEGKTLVNGQAALYVCRDYACQAPVTRPEDVARVLGVMQGSAKAARSPEIGSTRLAGSATTEGTERYRDRFEARGFRTLGRTSLFASRVGFGCYRVDERDSEHRAALTLALRSGVNLIDTSTNYTDGASERLVGQVLSDLVQKHAIARDEIIVVSKIGYAQGKNLELAMEREKGGNPFPEMVKVGQGIWHGMHPAWIEDQLGRSLERLALDTLDVCLIHNPEYFFTDGIRRGEGSLLELRGEFYRRIENAFGHLEKEAENGRIRFYGVSSNSSVESADDREFTSLEQMLECAKRAGGENHRFRILQLPANLLESGAVLVKNSADGTKTVLDLAREANVGVLVNRPLNAIVGDGLTRLADPPKIEGVPAVQEQLTRLLDLETEFRRTLAPKIRTGQGMPPADSLFNWAEQLAKLPGSAQTFAQWNDIETQVVVPRVLQVMSALDRAMQGEAAATWRDFRNRYGDEIEKTLLALRRRAAETSRRTTDAMQRAIDPLLPAEHRTLSFSQKALLALESAPGVSVVLVGMRQPDYVSDSLGAMSLPAIVEPAKVFQALVGFAG